MQEYMTEHDFRLAYGFQAPPKRTCKSKMKQKFRCSMETFYNLFPIALWIREYKWKEYIFQDILSGITVAVMHIPHGLAYSQLAGVPPVIGLYMAVFPIIPYIILGTSRHISLGTFAVLCTMAGDIVFEEAKKVDPEEQTEDVFIGIGACVAFTVGAWQVVLYMLQLGYFALFMSQPLISGFTTGAAFHVLTYQFKNFLGLQFDSKSGILRLIYYYMELFRNIQNTHMVTLYISIIFLTFLIMYYYILKPLIGKRYQKIVIYIPIELIVIAIGILVSYYLELDKNYGVHIVNEVPKGLPMPQVPHMNYFLHILFPCLPLALVAFSINLSLAKIFAKNSNYHVSDKQELLSYGVMNLFGSFFQCLPVAASLSRSVVQFNSGGKTQLASVFSMIIIILILLALGPIFEPVPFCVLSSIVAASVIGIALKIKELPRVFRRSFLDGMVWLCTFLSTIILDIQYGLFIGLALSVFTVLIHNHLPQVITLGKVRELDTPASAKRDIFIDLVNYKNASDVGNILIFRIIGGLNFSNIGHVEHKIKSSAVEMEFNPQLDYTRAIIVDLSAVSYVDPTAEDSLVSLIGDLAKINVRLFFASGNVKVMTELEKTSFVSFSPERVFATVADALYYATKINKAIV